MYLASCDLKIAHKDGTGDGSDQWSAFSDLSLEVTT